MSAFNFRRTGCVFGKIEGDTKPVADIAHNLKVELFGHGTNSLTRYHTHFKTKPPSGV
jgi:hypothetical protein